MKIHQEQILVGYNECSSHSLAFKKGNLTAEEHKVFGHKVFGMTRHYHAK